MNDFILQALEFKKQMLPEDYRVPNKMRDCIEEKLSELLEHPIEPTHKKAVTLQKSLLKKRNCILLFLYHLEVPPDNNGTEISIRNVIPIRNRFAKVPIGINVLNSFPTIGAGQVALLTYYFYYIVFVISLPDFPVRDRSLSSQT